MFTGLIQTTGTIAWVRARGAGARLAVRASASAPPRWKVGESVALDGACLTVAKVVRGGFEADLSSETLRRTTAGDWTAGRRVNLERALRGSDALGGHFVQGHVDGRGRVLALRGKGAGTVLRIAVPAALRSLVAEKGSITVDGVSLTVSKLGTGWFETALIPVTLRSTTLSERRAGDRVNLEADLLARYLARLLAGRGRGLGRRGPRRRQGAV